MKFAAEFEQVGVPGLGASGEGGAADCIEKRTASIDGCRVAARDHHKHPVVGGFGPAENTGAD